MGSLPRKHVFLTACPREMVAQDLQRRNRTAMTMFEILLNALATKRNQAILRLCIPSPIDVREATRQRRSSLERSTNSTTPLTRQTFSIYFFILSEVEEATRLECGFQAGWASSHPGHQELESDGPQKLRWLLITSTTKSGLCKRRKGFLRS